MSVSKPGSIRLLKKFVLVVANVSVIACGQTGELRLPEEAKPSPYAQPAEDPAKDNEETVDLKSAEEQR